MIEELGGTLTVNKLEGDAVLFYSDPDNLTEYPKLLIDRIQNCFEIFINRLSDIVFFKACPCDACHQMGNLRLKSFIHYGDFIIKKVSRFEEIAGENVILAHRLMKNSIDAAEYILFTKSVEEICDLEYLGRIENRTENCKGIGNIPISVFYPGSEFPENEKMNEMGLFKRFRTVNKYFKNIKTRNELRNKYHACF